MKKNFSASILILLLLFTSCASLARPELSPEEESALYPLASYVPETFDWQEIYDEAGVVPGIWRFDFESRDPNFPLIYHAVKIELVEQGTSGTTGTSGDEARFTLAASQWERTSDFAARENCIVAMNATPFDKTELAGIYKIGGEVWGKSS